jgi:hypothetical protein
VTKIVTRSAFTNLYNLGFLNKNKRLQLFQ